MTNFEKPIRSFRAWTSLVDTIVANGFTRSYYIVNRDDATVGRIFLNSVDYGVLTLDWNEKVLGMKELFKEIKSLCGSSFTMRPILNETYLYRVTC